MASSEEEPQVLKDYKALLGERPDLSVPVVAMCTLAQLLQRVGETTLFGINKELENATEILLRAFPHSIPLKAGCELFKTHVRRLADSTEVVRTGLLGVLEGASDKYIAMATRARLEIAKHSDTFIRDGSVILIHGMSRVVMEILLFAALERGKRFEVIVTEGRPDGAGYTAVKALADAKIPVSLVLDSAMGVALERAGMVLVGAEGVVESGGIVNKIGTFQLALCAQAMKKPFYVAAESFKFTRLYPLNQADLPVESVPFAPLEGASSLPEGAQGSSPKCDYTPAAYITLLFTDLGVLTPSAVSDELIKLYE
mmetsp:Transcript_28545/g.92612  ORF Transcript_28545/g.92612 Transcript_28545/m.92612 type:complete len:313 (+) Transcript_28545:1-939(+)